MNVEMTEVERKVIRFGSSLGVSLTNALKQIGADIGDIMNVAVRDDEIVIKKSRSKNFALPKGISPDFFDTLGTVMDEYDETLKGLKDR